MKTKTVQIRKLVLGEGRPKIAVPITGKNLLEIADQAQKIINQRPDMIEWRLDFFTDVTNSEKVQIGARTLRKIIGETALLLTFRTQAEGGRMALNEDDYFRIMGEVIRQKLGDALDLELYHDEHRLEETLEHAHKNGIVVIMSSHNFAKTPSKDKIIAKLSSMSSMGGDIAKVAVMPNSSDDVLTLLQATREAAAKLSQPVITMSMGELGKISRIAGETFGSVVSFAAGTQPSAPGQIELKHLRQILEDLKLN